MKTPARIAVLSGPLLSKRYGESGAAVTRAVEQLAGTTVVVSGSADAAGIRRDLQRALGEAPDAPVLLVGGLATLPFFEVPFSPRVDADRFVATDNPYGVPGTSTSLVDVALPSRAVGRIPDHPGDTAESFAARVGRLCAGPAGDGTGGWYVLSAKVWQGTTTAMAAGLGVDVPIDLAPPRAPADFADPSFVGASARRHLFNLHGSDRDARWFGEEAKKFPPALDPAAVAWLAAGNRLAGALVFSQACYGAFLLMPGGLRSARDACCLQFLEQGAAGFVGSTTIAYGGTTGGMVCSDVLAVEFLTAASRGAPLGAALLAARATLAASVRSPPAGAELKTLLQFVLYGDPARSWAPAPVAKARGLGAGPGVDEERARATLADYARWSEEEVPTAKGLRGVAPEDGWTETARFATGAPVAKGLRSGAPRRAAERRIYEQVRELDRDVEGERRAPASDVVYFREHVEREDGATLDAESTGGRSLTTILEERAGAEPWWRQPAPPRAPRGAKPRAPAGHAAPRPKRKRAAPAKGARRGAPRKPPPRSPKRGRAPR